MRYTLLIPLFLIGCTNKDDSAIDAKFKFNCKEIYIQYNEDRRSLHHVCMLETKDGFPLNCILNPFQTNAVSVSPMVCTGIN